MDFKTFIKPTLTKLILPVFVLIFIIYGDVFAPLLCGRDCPTTIERLVSSFTNVGHILMVLFIVGFLYLLLCSVVSFMNSLKK